MARNRLEAEYMAQQQHSKENTYSTYYRELDDEAKVRYREKLAILGHVDDPYIIARQSAASDWQQWPEVEYPDIFNYLLTTPSLYTQVCKFVLPYYLLNMILFVEYYIVHYRQFNVTLN